LPAARIRNAVARETVTRSSIIPPMLDAQAALNVLQNASSVRSTPRGAPNLLAG
jgi:hypothetical protein